MSDFFDKVGTERRARRHDDGNMPAGAATPTFSKQPPDTPRQALQPSGPQTGAQRWAANHDTFWGANQTYDELPAGLYKCDLRPNIGPVLVRQRVETDNLLELPDDASTAIIAEFARFWKIGHAFRKRGFLHKRGFLLWGPPGSGKTSTVQVLIKRLIEERGGVVLFLDDPLVAAECLRMARSIEPKRPMIAIMEDLDALIERYGENQFLSLLDGEAQVDSIVFLASTNYPERLDKRFVDRPSRFDTIRYVGMPSAAARRVYLSTKEPSLTGDELERWVKHSDGFSVAHLKELIIAVKCLGQPLEQAVERLDQMRVRKPTSEDSPDRDRAGFIGFRGHRNGHAEAAA